MKIVNYKCDICRETFIPETAIKENKVKAIYFTNLKKFEIRDLPQECDTHICTSCLEQIQNPNK